MTSAHSMLPTRPPRRLRRSTRITSSVLGVLLLVSCNAEEKLKTPTTLLSPYERPQLWAVAPFNNESGVSIVQTDRVADAFAEQAEGIEGVATIPVNRVLVAMARLNLPRITSPNEAIALMKVLDVDGLIVGTVTAYDPYRPLKFGAAVQLFRREPGNSISIDPYQATRTARETHVPSPQAIQAAAQASGVFDASNHQVLAWLEEYSSGRSEPGSAYGKRIYLASMEMYTQFVAYRLLHDLLDAERARLQPPATPSN